MFFAIPTSHPVRSNNVISVNKVVRERKLQIDFDESLKRYFYLDFRFVGDHFVLIFTIFCLRQSLTKQIFDVLLNIMRTTFLKNGPIPAFFIYLRLSIQLTKNVRYKYDWIRTADLWCQKRPLYQLTILIDSLRSYTML